MNSPFLKTPPQKNDQRDIQDYLRNMYPLHRVSILEIHRWIRDHPSSYALSVYHRTPLSGWKMDMYIYEPYQNKYLRFIRENKLKSHFHPYSSIFSVVHHYKGSNTYMEVVPIGLPMLSLIRKMHCA